MDIEGIDRVINQPLFFQYLFMTSAFAFTFILQSQLFYKCVTNKKLKEKLSANILVNIFAWLCTSFFGFLYIGYLLVKMEGRDRNTVLLFWTGTLCAAFGLTVSSTITFLMLDRVFVLIFPIQYNKTRRIYVFLTIFMCFGICLFSMANFVIIEFPLKNETTDCTSILCLLKNGSGVNTANLKLATGLVNIFVSLIFCLILHKYSSNALSLRQHFKKANLLIAIAVITEFLCNIIPLSVILLTTKLAIPLNIGSWPTILISIDGLSTAIIYKRIIRDKRKNSTTNVVFISTANPNTRV